MPTPSPRDTPSRSWILVAALVIVIAAAAALYWSRSDRRVSPATAAPATAGTVVPDPLAAEPKTPADDVGAGATEPASAPSRQWRELTGSAPVWPSDLSAPQDCERVEGDLQRICAVLDNRPYARELSGGYATCDLLRDVAGELASRPPNTSSELRSYETILANVFHLFRTLGRERMALPAKVLASEQQLAEPLAMAVYRWAMSRKSCEKSSPVQPAALYDYAGFLFNTMGGQAYLRRRTPRVEALTCFYALQVIDVSQREGHNPQGFDPRPEIARCRALLAPQPFAFTERYLANLDDMAARWEVQTR